MFCPISDQSLTNISHKNRTFIVLMQMIIFVIVALCWNEIPSPTYFWHEVVNAYNFRLRGDFRVEPLFSGSNNCKSTPQR